MILGTVALCPLARAALVGPSRNPYRRIIERNLFRLKPVVVPAVEPPHPPLPKITLNGITTILGDKRALLKIQYPVQPPERPREDSCILTEGQSDGAVKVVQIDVKSGSVKVNVSGTETVLTFAKDGPTAPAAKPEPAPRVRRPWVFPSPRR